MFGTLGVIGVIIAAIFILGIGALVWFVFMKIRFKTVSSNEALIITGTKLGDPKKDSSIYYNENTGSLIKVMRGGGHFLKMFQHAVRIPLTSMEIYLKSLEVPTKQGVGIYGVANATIKVSDNIEGVVKYAEQFLGKKPEDIREEITKVLDANFRAILAEMTVEEINQDGAAFNERVRSIAQKQLDRMGFKITSFGLTDLRDNSNYLINLGKPQIAIIKKQAEIAESENKRITEIQIAEDNEAIKREQYAREMNISEARRDRDIREANFLAETEKERAVAEAVYETEKEIKRKIIVGHSLEIERNEKTVALEIKQMERANDVKLEEQEVQVRKFRDDTEYYTKTRQAEAEAEAKIAQGEADAQVIRVTSEAEAEAIEKRAEAMSKHDNVALREKLIEIMPEYARSISDSIRNVESIRIMDSGSGDQVNSIPKMVTNLMAQSQESIEQMTGLNIKDIIESVSGVNKKDIDIKDAIPKDFINNLKPEQIISLDNFLNGDMPDNSTTDNK